MELSTAGDDVLSTLFSVALDQRVGLGELVEAVNELGQLGGVLGLDSHADDWGH